MVLQMMVLSEKMVILVTQKAWNTEIKPPLIQNLRDYAQMVFLSYLKWILSTSIERTGTLVRLIFV